MAEKKRHTLRDTLKELENPAFSVTFNDPEDDDITAAKVSTSDTHLEDSADSLKRFGNLRKKTYYDNNADYHNLDPKYFGQKTLRINLAGWSGDESAAADDDDDDDVDDKQEETDDGQEIEDEEEKKENEIDIINNENDEFHNLLSGSNDEDKEDDDFSDTEIVVDPNMLPDDLKKGTNVMFDPIDERDGEVNKLISNKVGDEFQKGRATKAQLELLDKLLESRIRLQKSVQLSNRLPQHDTLKDFKKEGGAQVKERYISARTSLVELLNNLLTLQELLLKRNADTASILTSGISKKQIDSDEEILSDTEDEKEEEDHDEIENNELNLPSKRKHTLTVIDYEEEISKRHKAFQAYEEMTINKWYEKTRLSSGKTSSKNFGAFDKSALQQIKKVLSDKDRLIKRTQLRRTPYNILGKVQDTDLSNESQVEDSHLKDYDENIFDDGDFYHEMLKELIERKSNINSDDPVTSGRQWLELQRLRTKIKRKIDTRASKGRKVRYDVHSKLVSFMAPQNVGSMSDQARNDLFSSLFGGGLPYPIR